MVHRRVKIMVLSKQPPSGYFQHSVIVLKKPLEIILIKSEERDYEN
jgi:hypothetical protein